MTHAHHEDHTHTDLELALASKIKDLQEQINTLSILEAMTSIQKLALLELLPYQDAVVEVQLPEELHMELENGSVVTRVAIFRDNDKLNIHPIA